MVKNLAIREPSSSSNSENGDHTYNPYSFKRLQDAIFKKDTASAFATTKAEKSQAQLEGEFSGGQESQHKDSAQFLPLQRVAKKIVND